MATLLTYFAQVLKPTRAAGQQDFFHFCCEGTRSHFPRRGGRREEYVERILWGKLSTSNSQQEKYSFRLFFRYLSHDIIMIWSLPRCPLLQCISQIISFCSKNFNERFVVCNQNSFFQCKDSWNVLIPKCNSQRVSLVSHVSWKWKQLTSLFHYFFRWQASRPTAEASWTKVEGEM